MTDPDPLGLRPTPADDRALRQMVHDYARYQHAHRQNNWGRFRAEFTFTEFMGLTMEEIRAWVQDGKTPARWLRVNRRPRE